MKKYIAILLLLCLLFCVGCGKSPQGHTESTPAAAESKSDELVLPTQGDSIPQELPGVWTSASAGKLNLTETITFGEDGSLTVSGNYQGTDAGTIYGSYWVEHNQLHCSITSGATPFEVTYSFHVDGRELTLTDDDGDAVYLRTS